MKNSGFSIALVSTGTELTAGRSQDTNSPFLAQELEGLGQRIHSISILPDNPKTLLAGLEALIDQGVSHIIITGGLGPTADDHTMDVLSMLSNATIVECPAAFKQLEKAARLLKGRLLIAQARRQIRTLEGARTLLNKSGLAPGLSFKIRQSTIFALPGVPQEMEQMFKEQVRPAFDKESKRINRQWWIYGIGESSFQKLLQDSGIVCEWGVTAGYGFIKFSLLHGNPLQLNQLTDFLKFNFPDSAFEQPVELELAALLERRRLTCGCAESCTGGLAGKIMTDLPGSSAYFKGSLVCYANQAKEAILYVPARVLEKNGAVSEECARAMAEGARKALQVNYSVSITGIAGPEGGTIEKPVGTVWFGLATPNGTFAEKSFIPLDRDRIRRYSACTALFFLYREILRQQS